MRGVPALARGMLLGGERLFAQGQPKPLPNLQQGFGSKPRTGQGYEHEFDEHEQNQLAVRYSVSGQPPRRPSYIPSVTNVLATHGHAEDTLAQRRGSAVGTPSQSRRPSIAPAVTEYLKTH